jgi:hypothetical protein
MCASRTGRFIADSWFSDEPLPAAYTLPAAEHIRKSGGVTGNREDIRALSIVKPPKVTTDLLRERVQDSVGFARRNVHCRRQRAQPAISAGLVIGQAQLMGRHKVAAGYLGTRALLRNLSQG